MIQLETKRLTLLPITNEYTEDIFKYFTNEIGIYMYGNPNKNISEAESFVSSTIQKNINSTSYSYVITLKLTSEFIGLVGLHGLNNDIPGFGIWIKAEAHGNHYGKETIGRLIEYAKNLGYKKLLYPVDKRNIASKKIPLYFDGKFTGSVEKNMIDGRVLFIENYEINI